MKKPILGTIALVVALSVSSATAFAACPGHGRNFVDANGDGICDNCGIYHRCGMTGGGCGRGSQKGRGNGCRGGRCR